jgi:hydrogenase-1 operon protein HyaF
MRHGEKDRHGMARRRVKDFDFLAGDGLVDALLMEVADLLQNFLAHRRAGVIDLLGLPLSGACLAELEERLGTGEISVLLRVSGESQIRETAFSGVWWTRHLDETGRVVGLLIEVADVPEILRANPVDMQHGLRRLGDVTNFAQARPAR